MNPPSNAKRLTDALNAWELAAATRHEEPPPRFQSSLERARLGLDQVIFCTMARPHPPVLVLISSGEHPRPHWIVEAEPMMLSRFVQGERWTARKWSDGWAFAGDLRRFLADVKAGRRGPNSSGALVCPI